MYTTETSSEFVKVSKTNLCPLCGKPDWCKTSPDNEVVMCPRTDITPPGWKRIKDTVDGHGIYALETEDNFETHINSRRPTKRISKPKPAPIPAGSKLLRLPAPQRGPEPQKPTYIPKGVPVSAVQINYRYSDTQEILRFEWLDPAEPKGRDKTCRQTHINGEGEVKWSKGDAAWPAYRIDEVVEILKCVPDDEPVVVLMLEGEPNVELGRLHGIAALTLQGSNWNDSETAGMVEALRATGKNITLGKLRDNDSTGVKKGSQIQSVCDRLQFPCIVIDPVAIYPDIPDKGDIKEILDNMDADEFIRRLEAEIHRQVAESARAIDSIGETNSNVVTHPRFTPPDSEKLTEQFAKIYNAGLSGHKLTIALQPLGVNLQQTRRNYEEYVEEIEQEEQRADRKADVEKLISIGKRRLTLENYLHPVLAEPIKQLATRMGVDPETILTFLLPIAAGLMNPNSSIVAKECINFEEPFLLYMMVAACTGDRKSPALKVVQTPLKRLQSVEDERYNRALQIYEAELQALKETKGKDKGDSELPQKPKPPREFFVDNVTVEGLDKIKGQQPDHGLTLIKDELSGLFASHGAYKGGKGSDKESYLSGWNGGGLKKNRAGDGSRVSLARDSLSITGAIQPDKLRALLGDFSDAQGEWARFLFYHMSSRSYKIPRDDQRFGMADLLEDIYKKIDALPIIKLRFENQGQTHFDDWYDKKDEQKLAENRPGLRAAIAKMPGQAVRLIGVLHVLYEVANGSVEVPQEVPLARIQAGCKLADFYLGQVTLLQGDGDALNGDLTPVLKGLLDKVNQRGCLTATEAKKMIWSLRKSTPDKIRQFFSELAAMDLADVKGTGSKFVLVSKVLMSANNHQQNPNPSSARVSDCSTPKELRIVDEVLMNHQQSESFNQQGIQDKKHKNVDGVDVFDKISHAEINIQSSKVEPDGAIDDLIEIPTTIINTSTSSTVGSQTHVQQESQTVDEFSAPASTVWDSSTDNLTETPPIAPPEPKTAPPEPPKSNAAEMVNQIVATLRKAIANIDRKAAREVWKKVKDLPTQVEALKAELSKDENTSLRLLLNVGLVKGQRVRYIGTKWAEHLGGMELIVDDLRSMNGIPCIKPDGSYTTDLSREDLQAID